MLSKVGIKLLQVKSIKLTTKHQRRKFHSYKQTIDEAFQATYKSIVSDITLDKLKGRELIEFSQPNILYKNYYLDMTQSQKEDCDDLCNAFNFQKVGWKHASELSLHNSDIIETTMKECIEYLDTGIPKFTTHLTHTFQDKVYALSRVSEQYSEHLVFKQNLKKLILHSDTIRSHNVFQALYCIHAMRKINGDHFMFFKSKLLSELSEFVFDNSYVFNEITDKKILTTLKYAKRRVQLHIIYGDMRRFIKGMIIGVILAYIHALICVLFL